ncbi:MAG: hypothetical protein QOC71_72 [Thermoplasmata archaeon]|nr:hypothetical protein [Thermoplasmata archaeon]
MADAPAVATEAKGPLASLKVNFLTKALAVLLVGLVIVYLLWVPLGLPAVLLNKMTSGIGPQSCEQYTVGTSQMKTCATTVGAKKVLGPLIVGIAMFVLRKQIGKGMKKLEGSGAVRKAEAAMGFAILRPIVPAVAAIVLFTMGWAAIHDATRGSPGLPLFNQQRFPVLVGLFTLASTHFAPAIHRGGAAFFARRDRYKLWMRIVLVTLVSIVVSYLIMTKSGGSTSYLEDPGLKEQTVVVFSLVVGWVMLTPVSKPGPPSGTVPTSASPTSLGQATPPPPPGVRR